MCQHLECLQYTIIFKLLMHDFIKCMGKRSIQSAKHRLMNFNATGYKKFAVMVSDSTL